MKVLLTGASGFVGSHVLDRLCEREIPTAVLQRPTSSRQFFEPHLPSVEVRHGSILQPDGLQKAMEGITHVVHCAGCTKAIRAQEFYQVNQGGTRNLVAAVNSTAGVRQFIHISSLAAAGPGTREHPMCETEPARPVSEYGRSKLAGEIELQKLTNARPVIVRPPAVYGPRDAAFLALFKTVRNHFLPMVNPRQALSLVYVRDLSRAIVDCIDHPKAAGKSYFVAGPETVTASEMAHEIATQMHTWTVPFPVPAPVLWPICLACDIGARLTGRANILSVQKYPELTAPGWVCDGALFRHEVGSQSQTTLAQGVSGTLEWYRQAQWL